MRNFYYWLIILICRTYFSYGQVTDYHTSVEIKNNKVETTYEIKIKINDRKESEKYSEVEIFHSDQNELKIHEVYLLDGYGEKIRKLKKKDFSERSAKFSNTFFMDYMVTSFDIKHNTYPYFIYYKYSITEESALDYASWDPYLYYKLPTSNATLKITLPAEEKVRILNDHNIPVKRSSDKDEITYLWQVNNFKLLEKEAYGESPTNLAPEIIVLPENFDYIKPGSYESWKSIGNWQYNVIKDRNDLPETDKQIVQEICQKSSSQREIISKLYNYLQNNTRYINISIDKGGLDPYPASYVSKNKYGDCKALTIYMKSLLEEAGIDSYYTLVNAGEEIQRINRDFPSLQFNHVILAVPVQSDTLWLENTTNILPFGYIGSFTQNRYGFLINQDQSKFVRIPKLSNEDIKVISTYDFQLNENGEGKATFNKIAKGIEYEELADLNSVSDKNLTEEYIDDFIRLKNYVVNNWNIKKNNEDNHSLILSADLSIKKASRKIGPYIILDVPHYRFKKLNIPSERKTGLKFDIPIYNIDQYIYKITNIDYSKIQLPNDKVLSSKFGEYKQNFRIEGDKLIVQKSLKIYSGEYDKKSYQAFYEFTDKIQEIQNQSIIKLQ
ncbi:DUF3857 domain-containing protein [Mangrovivirga cuniculi]|uniref:DUF3857 domain-containing protein n=1 Tax=Mangrovivirga cuniculi TaxID=2715131 RepID=A0A4D7K824_9BACT|nr:DUF3857 domain-containing protein [Mangrovivirga cuniculi]QCK16884.1 hypothetical protein DCC35_20180 [Mangrovivirga cuniculi]